MRLSNIKSFIVAIGAVCSFHAGQAYAATFASTNTDEREGTLSMVSLNAAETEWSARFTTSGGDARFSFLFTVNTAFNLDLSSFETIQTSGGASTLAGLRNISAPTPGPGNTAGEAPDIATDGCLQASNMPTRSNCFRIGNTPATDPVRLFSNLAAGDYAFDVYEGNGRPSIADFSLAVSAVPIPAAGVLFGSALLGAAAIRRRSLRHTLGMPKAC